MSIFEKIIVSLIDNNIKSIDLTDVAGFIDAYEYDPDHPSGPGEFYLVYDAKKQNDFTIDRAIRFEQSKKIKRTYIKYVNAKPLLVYSFWLEPKVRSLFSGVLHLTTLQKAQVLQFWGALSNVTDFVMSNQVIQTNTERQMPLADYRPNRFEAQGLTITQKGALSKQRVPPFFVVIQHAPAHSTVKISFCRILSSIPSFCRILSFRIYLFYRTAIDF